MKENISPEEKLLRLIRGKKPRDKLTEEKTQALQGLKPNPKLALSFSFQRYLSYLNLSKIIASVFILSCAYLLTSFIYSFLGLKKIKLPQTLEEKQFNITPDLKSELKTFEFYQQGTQGKQIFGALPEQGQINPSTGVNMDLLKDLNLVGVIMGDSPQAVIEDKSAQKTYYVNKGQFIGEFQVEDIQEGKIILNYHGQRFELHL